MRCLFFIIALFACGAAVAGVTQSHGYAQFGLLKYPASFQHFDWVNPEAPKGGTIRLMVAGTFDTLNPYTLKGSSPIAAAHFLQYGVTELNEPLMVGTGIYDPSGDEPASSYGLIAESVEFSEDRSWVAFNLRPEAKFHDGKAITADDVVFSYELLSRSGHPQYRTNLQEVKRVDRLGQHKVRFVFKRAGNPLLIMRIGEMPVLPKHYWETRDFSVTTFEPPLSSGPYQITQVIPGRRLVFSRVKNWWGENLPVNRGKYNADRVEVEFYRDNHVAFQAFKAGEFDFYIDNQAKNWSSGYRFPAVTNGQIIRAQIPHKIPTQTQALFLNTRRTTLSDPAVREALGLMFDFEWTNRTLFSNAYQRANSYYPNSEFSATGIPEGAEWLLLKKHREQLPAELFTQAPELPKTDGRGIPRETMRNALTLLAKAGWKPVGNELKNAKGERLDLEILLVNPSLERILQPYTANLASIGIKARLRTVDRSQYKQRLDHFDFDMALITLPQTLSPGLEQWQYFHSSQASVKGSKNYAGVNDPVVDDLIEQLLSATTEEDQRAATKALDRVLLWQHYSIPNWYINSHRLAYRNRFDFISTPPYTLGLRSWWIKPSENAQ